MDEDRDCDLWKLYYCPDYVDAYSILGAKFNNISDDNYARVNDPYLQSLFKQALAETNPNSRQQIYMHIQSYLFDVSTKDHEWKYPHAPLFTLLETYVHVKELKGVNYNAMNILDCWNWYMEPS